jgi:hypothetical protein
MSALKSEIDACRREQVVVTIFSRSCRFEGRIVELSDEMVVLGNERERCFIPLDRVDALVHG